jgi:LPS O-antigen subunit length determinant protein (WzzB/FepE family)
MDNTETLTTLDTTQSEDKHEKTQPKQKTVMMNNTNPTNCIQRDEPRRSRSVQTLLILGLVTSTVILCAEFSR